MQKNCAKGPAASLSTSLLQGTACLPPKAPQPLQPFQSSLPADALVGIYAASGRLE